MRPRALDEVVGQAHLLRPGAPLRRLVEGGEAASVLLYGPPSLHLTTKTDSRVGDWAKANNVELAYVPFYASWLNRIEAQFTALRYFALDGTDHENHRQQAQAIRRYIA